MDPEYSVGGRKGGGSSDNVYLISQRAVRMLLEEGPYQYFYENLHV